MSNEEIKKELDDFKSKLLTALTADVKKINDRLDQQDKFNHAVKEQFQIIIDVLNNRNQQLSSGTTIINKPRNRSCVEDLGRACGFGIFFED